jgi:hypothetical protein
MLAWARTSVWWMPHPLHKKIRTGPSDPYQSARQGGLSYSANFTQEITMKLLTDLFTTDYGIMSISGIAFMICMAIFFIWYFNHKMNEPASQVK